MDWNDEGIFLLRHAAVMPPVGSQNVTSDDWGFQWWVPSVTIKKQIRLGDFIMVVENTDGCAICAAVEVRAHEEHVWFGYGALPESSSSSTIESRWGTTWRTVGEGGHAQQTVGEGAHKVGEGTKNSGWLRAQAIRWASSTGKGHAMTFFFNTKSKKVFKNYVC